MLTEETEVPLAALPVDAFKAHLRLGTGFAGDVVQDEVLESFLRAAIAVIEARTGKALFERDFAWRVTAWRSPVEQVLPVAPVSAVSELRRVSGEGAEAVIAADAYRLVVDTYAPRLTGRVFMLPTIPTGGAMVIRFTAGFGAAWDDVPPDLRHAVMLLAAHYYEYRGETVLDEGCMPFGVSALLARYRTFRLGAAQ
ncbi:gene transfer agent protein [Oceanicola sp. 22II-s10i]|uniref:head-tail connector protein n=1 Tax=Oceanicola sp. 22II-s10i TaxID=1317116 RepID=UPI000B527A05|nr:head-tail connector protein [Oceanicola sp. 22II-s10i]OWU85308.1 gene transfer agent protein [Oceanicola sp. 22II-s10i]